MAKRVPPSRRPERVMDETAKAIAQSRLAAKPEKSEEEEGKSEHGKSFSHSARQSQKVSRPTVSNAASTVTKRNKSGGG